MSDRVSNWLKDRLGLDDLPFFRTPDYMYKVDVWLGALVAAAFIYTVISGLILLLYYDPDNAYTSTMFIVDKVPYGSVALYSHLYGSYAMIILAYVHMFRNYFDGAYKRPRELLWIIGVLLLALTLGTAFLGYTLIGDALAASAVDVGSGIVSSIPGLSGLVPVMFGNYDAGQYGRVLALHIILAALIGVIFVVHFFLAEHYGMMPSRKEKPKAPAVYTKEEWMKFNPWWPRNFVYMMSLVFLTWGFILVIPSALAYLNGLPQQLNPFLNPKPAPPPNSPAAAHITTYPPWFFLFVYKIADFSSNVLLDLMIAAIIPIVYLILLPFLDGSSELHPLKRKVFTGIGILMITYLIQNTIWGDLTPGVEVSVSQQIMAFLPPAVIVAIGMFFLPSPKNPETKSVPTTTTNVSPGVAKFVNVQKPIINAVGGGAVSSETKKKFAEVLISILYIYTVILAVLIWTIPSTGDASNLFGIDLGLIFIMLGEAISLYHYVVYRK